MPKCWRESEGGSPLRLESMLTSLESPLCFAYHITTLEVKSREGGFICMAVRVCNKSHIINTKTLPDHYSQSDLILVWTNTEH